MTVALVVAGLWVASHVLPARYDWRMGDWSWHVESNGGTFSVQAFRTAAEDPLYRHVTLHWWEMDAICVTLLVVLEVRRRRRHDRGRRGFPVQSDGLKDPIDRKS